MSPQKCDSDFYSAGNNVTHLQKVSQQPKEANYDQLHCFVAFDELLIAGCLRKPRNLKQEVKMFDLTRAGPLLSTVVKMPVMDHHDLMFAVHPISPAVGP